MPVLLSVLLGALGAVDLPAAAAAGKPFDLTYLPRVTPSVIAVRPGALAKHLGDQDKPVGEMIRRTLAAAFAFIDGDLKSAAPPPLADIDQVIVAATLTLGVEQQQNGQSTMALNGVSSGLVRTAAPFDWAGRVKKWFPKAEAVKHAGREYLRVPVSFGKDTSYLGLYVADARTLAFDIDEDEIKGMLARLDKKLVSAAPAGWDEVSRDLVAFCHDTTATGWLTAPEKPKREIDRALVTAFRKATGVAIGLTAGDCTTFRVVAAARNADDAKEVREAFKAMLSHLAADDTDPLVAKLLSRMTVTRDGTTVRAEGSVADNLLRHLLDPGTER